MKEFLNDFKTIEEFKTETNIEPTKIYKELLHPNSPLYKETKEFQLKMAQNKILTELNNSVEEKIQLFRDVKEVNKDIIDKIKENIKNLKDINAETEEEISKINTLLNLNINQLNRMNLSQDIQILEDLMKTIKKVYEATIILIEKEEQGSILDEKGLVEVFKSVRNIVDLDVTVS